MPRTNRYTCIRDSAEYRRNLADFNLWEEQEEKRQAQVIASARLAMRERNRYFNPLRPSKPRPGVFLSGKQLLWFFLKFLAVCAFVGAVIHGAFSK